MPTPHPTRRRFLKSAIYTTGSAALIAPPWLRAASAELDPAVARVLSRTIGIDMHNHVYPPGTEPHPHFGPQPGIQNNSPQKEGPPQGAPPPAANDQTGPALSLAGELQLSGLSAVCASYVLDFAANDKPEDVRTNLLHWFDAIDAQLEQGHIRRALTIQDIQFAHDHAKPTIVQSVEGSQFIEGKLERVEEVYRRGMRHLQLLHMRDDLVAPLGDINTAPPKFGGLTPFGAQIIKECNRLGMLVDMAHANHETVLGALKVATQPFIVSHTNLDIWTGKDLHMAEMMKAHLISKEHARVVADAGGIVGVWTHLADSPQEFVESIKVMVDAIGIDHTGIGTDTDLLSSRIGGTNRAWPGLTQGFFPVVVAEMLRQGFTPEEIAKVGGENYCRVFGKVTAGHA